MATRKQPRRGAKAVEEPKPQWHGGPPEILPNEIKLDKMIGEGSFGKVYAGTCRGVKVAIKVPARQMTDSELQDLRQEVSLLSSIYHPNVVLFMGACTKEDNLMIVTELKDGTVESMLKSERERRRGTNGGKQQGIYLTSSPAKGGVSSNVVAVVNNGMSSALARMKMARDTALGTNWLHNISHIIHRDLKTANLLWDEASGRVCVTDFGLSQALAPAATAQDRFGPRGSALFMAPEVIRQLPFDHRVDTYSFGIVLWELWTCEEPFVEFYDYDTFVDAVHVRGLRPAISSDLHLLSLLPPLPSPPSHHHAFHSFSSTTQGIDDMKRTGPPRLVELMKACWADSPAKRPSDFEHILHQLDLVVVELSLTYWTDAAVFWQESFCKEDLQEKVSWHEFVAALESATSLRKTTFEPLAPFLLTSDGKYVTISQFADTVEWFGRWYNRSEAEETMRGVKAVTEAEWFVGPISRQAAESHLNNKSSCPLPDSFIVRLSASVPGCPFTITRPSHSTRRPNLRVRRLPRDYLSHYDRLSLFNPQIPFDFVVDYGPDGFSPAYPSPCDLIEGCKHQLRLLNPAPPLSSSSGY